MSRKRNIDSRLSRLLRELLRDFGQNIKKTSQMVAHNHLSVMAGSLSFFCLFSLIPFFILCSYVARWVVGIEEFSSVHFISFIETLAPSIAPWISRSIAVLMQKNVTQDTFTIALLTWTTYELFRTLQRIFERISVKGDERDLVGANFIAIFSFLLTISATTLLLVLISAKAETLRMLAGEPAKQLSVVTIKQFAVSFSIGCVLFSTTLIYWFLPTQHVSFFSAFQGSLLFLALFFLGKVSYQFYVKMNASLNSSLYGGFSGLIFLFVWIYYLSCCFIFSGQFAIVLEEKKKVK